MLVSMHVHSHVDPGTARDFLETDRLWAAYALGDLDPNLNKLSEWYAAEDDRRLRSLVLLFKGFDPPALFAMGDAQGVATILGSALRAPRVYLSLRDEHMPAVRAHYRLGAVEPMWRMALRPAEFRPVRGSVTHLTPQYTKELERLYTLGGGDAFTPSQVFAGAFFGVEERGRLIAAAGTHVLSETYSTAAVGNVFTHPDRRGQGQAAVVTSAVCSELIRRGIRTIVLNVAQSNGAAIHVYEKLGFKKVLTFNEGVAARRPTH
jgi:ribosomal protein S18 acetylase RimI-like enzyme